MIDAHGVIHCVGQLAHDADFPMGICRSGEAHGLEIVSAHGLRATEGKEQSAWAYLLHSLLIDVAIAFQTLLQIAVILGESGRVKNDDIKLVAHRVEILQHVGHNAFMRCVLAEVQRHIAVA